MSESPPRSRRNAILLVLPVLILLIPLGYSVVTSLFAQSGPAADGFLERPDPKHENCVRETEYMRFHHWELLRQTREDVVRYGVRGEIGLNKCGECHKSRERFCDRCHEATSLRPDCWGCHYYP